MVKVIYGKKGEGKTKILVDTANKMSAESKGDVVFIDDSNHLMYDLQHKVRFINVADFPIGGAAEFLGFVCGVISEDYDIDGIFIDGLTYIIKQKAESLESFFKSINSLAEKFNVRFYFSINGDNEVMPEFMKAYVM